MRTVLSSLSLLALGAGQGAACSPAEICIADGGVTVQANRNAISEPYTVGDILPRESINMVLNTEYHGLPAPDGTFWYVQSDGFIYRMKIDSREILGRVDGRRN